MNLFNKSSLLLLSIAILFIQLSVIVLAAYDDDNIPQQIHLSYNSSYSEMWVTWQTENFGSTEVRFGLAPNTMNTTVKGEAHYWKEGNENGTKWRHKVLLSSLLPSTRYFYRAITSRAASPIFFFTTMSTPEQYKLQPPRFLVFGDMGRTGGAISLKRLIDEVETADPPFAAIIHIGDFAYDLHNDGGKRGDDFMNRIEAIAAYVPYMTCPGNHETFYRFSHYKNRFVMPVAHQDHMHYSFDIANIHFVSYSTEVYFSGVKGGAGSKEKQLEWLKQDLAAANANRHNVPWIIAFGHRPMYCSNIDHDDCTTNKSVVRHGLEEVMFQYGVDLIFEAHEHSYERLWPVFNETVTQKDYINPKAPVHIITGAAGCNEQGGICINAILGPKGPWSAFRDSFRFYGFGHLEVKNNTHLYWNEIVDHNGEIIDEIWIEQQNHGPFPPINFG